MKRLSLTQNFLTKYQNHSIVSNLLDFLPVHRLIKICKPNKFLTNKFLKEKIKISGYNNLANIYIFYNLKDFYEYFQTIRYESLYEYQLIIIYLIKNNISNNNNYHNFLSCSKLRYGYICLIQILLIFFSFIIHFYFF